MAKGELAANKLLLVSGLFTVVVVKVTEITLAFSVNLEVATSVLAVNFSLIVVM